MVAEKDRYVHPKTFQKLAQRGEVPKHLKIEASASFGDEPKRRKTPKNTKKRGLTSKKTTGLWFPRVVENFDPPLQQLLAGAVSTQRPPKLTG